MKFQIFWQAWIPWVQIRIPTVGHLPKYHICHILMTHWCHKSRKDFVKNQSVWKDLKWCAESKVQIVLDLNSQIKGSPARSFFKDKNRLSLGILWRMIFFFLSWIHGIVLILGRIGIVLNLDSIIKNRNVIYCFSENIQSLCLDIVSNQEICSAW